MQLPRIAAFCTVLTLLSAPVAAQDVSAARQGLSWGLAVSAGGAHLTCDLCDTSRDLGGGAEAIIGSWAAPALRVSLEGGMWTRSDDNVRENVFTAGIVGAIYPRQGSGLHLIGGLGWTGYRVEDFTYDAVLLRLGAGWDLPLMEGWVAGNRITVDGSSFSSLRNDGTAVSPSVGLSVVRLTLYLRRR